MRVNIYGLVIVAVAAGLLFVVPKFRARLHGLAANGWTKIVLALWLLVLTGVLQFLLGWPAFVNLFVPELVYWLTVLSQLTIAAGAVMMIWGIGNIVSSMHQIETQKSDDEEWRALYLNLQDLSQQPFSFVEILNLAINQLLKRSESDGAAVLLYKENTEELILAAYSNLPPDITKRIERLAVTGDVFGRVQKLARTQNITNVAETDQATAALFAGSGFLSLAVYPLRARDRVLGSVALFSTRPFHFHQRRAAALNVATNHLATLLESARNEKEILRLKDRLRPSEEAKRITEELFFRRGIGSNLELREAVEFERVRKFFDADCIKLVFKDAAGEFRVKASSGGAETGLLLDQRKLPGLNRAVSERKLLLLTSPKSAPAGRGFDSMPRQTLFVPVPYPDRDDLVFLLESENASLEFSEEKLSAVRVASVYLADLHFLFLAKREGERFRLSVAQLDACLRQLLEAETPEQIAAAISDSASGLVPQATVRIVALASGGDEREPVVEQSGLRFGSEAGRARQSQLLTEWIGRLTVGEENERRLSRAELVAMVSGEGQMQLAKALAGLPETVTLWSLPMRTHEAALGAIVLLGLPDEPMAKESLELLRRLVDVGSLKLARRTRNAAPVATPPDPIVPTTTARRMAAPAPPPEPVGSNGTSLLDFVTWHRIDSNVDAAALAGENRAVPAAIEALVKTFFSERAGRRLFLSSFEDEHYRYFQLTVNEVEMRRFREQRVDVGDWQPAVVALDFPEAFRSLPAEYAVAPGEGNVETLVWRFVRADRKKDKGRRLNILGIDDQEVIRDLLTNIITRMGHRISTVAGGHEALRLFRQEHFDLVIAEAGLPDISGWSIAEQVKLLAPQTPVIILSGWDSLQRPERMASDAADFVLTKPFKMEQLDKMIGAACEMIAG